MRNIFTILLSILLMRGALSAQDYVPFSLESLGAGSPHDGTTVALGINDSGVVVGTSRLRLKNQRHACYWPPTGGVTDIGTLGGTYSVGYAINNQGEIVGASSDSSDVGEQAFLWTPGAGMQDLPSLGLGVQDVANAINNNGAVVGYSCLGSQCTGDYHAFLWTPSGGIQDLGTLPGGIKTFAYGINSANHVVGTVQLPNGGAAFIWTPTTGMQELAPGSGLQGYGAVAINDSDEVIGYFVDPTDNESHAFLWTQANGLKDLGVLPGGWSEAIGINNSGDIVGFARDAKGSGYSVIWRQGGTIQELTHLAGVGLNEAASGINTAGQIAANGSKPYMLTPTWVKLSAKSVKFGSWPVGQTSTGKSVTLTNLGSKPLAISSITIGGVNAGDFSEKNTCGSSLAAEAKCIIKITFTPTATGARYATIYVADSDWTSPQQVSLTGTGN